MSVISLALWTRIAQLASPIRCQQLLCFCYGILVLQAPQPRLPGRTGCLARDPLLWWGSLDTQLGTCSDLAQSPHTGVPTPTYSEWSKLVSMAISILIFYHPSWHAWTLNTAFSGLLHSNMPAAVQGELVFSSIPAFPSVCRGLTIIPVPLLRRPLGWCKLLVSAKFSALLFP